MKTINTLLAGLLIVPFMIGCSGDSNALKEYPDLKGEAPTDKKPIIQTVADTTQDRYFSVQVMGQDAVNFVSVAQGQTAKVQLKITVNHPGIKSYTVQMAPFALPDAPTLAQNQDGTYTLTWTPPVGTVQKGDNDKKFLAGIQVIVKDADAGDAAKTEALKKIASTFNIMIEVKEFSAQPSIESRSKLEAIEEGVASKMEVVVDDPGSATDNVASPEIVITSFPYTNKEAYRADGAPYVFVDGVERVQGTKWKFHLTVYAQNLPMGRDRLGNEVPNADKVPVCFYMRALGVTERLSGKQEVCMTGTYAAQAPTMSFAAGTPDTISAGVETVFTVKVNAANPQSKITLKAPLKQIAGLSGAKAIDCSYDNGTQTNALTCTVKWTPACVRTAAKTTLTITADSTLNGKVRSNALSKDITVSPNPQCTGGR